MKQQDVLKSVSDNVDAIKLVQCFCCEGEHQLWHCNLFKEFDLEKKTKVVKKHRLCFNCLRAGHERVHCKLSKSCSRCHRRRNTLLHGDVSNSSAHSKKSLPSKPKKTTSVNIASNQCAAKINQCGRKLHKVVPVSFWVDNPSNSLTN